MCTHYTAQCTAVAVATLLVLLLLLQGTLSHMSPELLAHGHASRASDAYAMGILLFEMATGLKAFAGVSLVCFCAVVCFALHVFSVSGMANASVCVCLCACAQGHLNHYGFE